MIKKNEYIRSIVLLLMIFYTTKNYSQKNELQLGLGLSIVENVSKGFDTPTLLFNYSRSLKEWFSIGIEFSTTTKNNLPKWFNDNVIFNPSERFDQIVSDNIVGKEAFFDLDNPINYYNSNLFLIKPNFILNPKKKFNITVSPLIGIGTVNQTELLLISFTHINGIITRVNEYQVVSWVRRSGHVGANIGGNYNLSEKYSVALNSRIVSRFSGGIDSDSFGSTNYFSFFFGFGYKF